MTANSDAGLFVWVAEANRYGGSFVKAIALAALCADDENYALLRPVLLQLKDKYPKYGHMQEKT
ncbi:MAG TPA: hypothetical protein VER98_18555 [Terriglobia bacterium]|nr:hypothetical protein [Terriglobia bacterium]